MKKAEYVDRIAIRIKVCTGCTMLVDGVCRDADPCEKLIAGFLEEPSADVVSAHGKEQAQNDMDAPMSNADRINAMTIEEKAEFLSSIAYGRETPWCEQFAEKFCKSCQTTTCTVEGYHHPLKLHECDFSDGKCPHGGDIVWWLQQPVEDGANG